MVQQARKKKISDSRLKFFYQRFVKNLENIDSIKNSKEDLYLTPLEIKNACKEISTKLGGDRKYNFLI